MTKETKNYVDKKQLYADLCEWKIKKDAAIANGEKVPSLPHSVGVAIYQIAENMSLRYNFRGYSYREEMVGNGIVSAVRALQNFNPEVKGKSGEPNPFGYITLYVWRGMLNHIGYEKAIQEKKLAYMSDPSNEFYEHMEGEEFDIGSGGDMADFIWEN